MRGTQGLRAFATALVCVLWIGWSPGGAAPRAEALTVEEIVAAMNRFDGQEVTLVGTAEGPEWRVSKRGNEYTTFALADKGERVKVFSFGKLPIKSGERVEVHGIFQRVTHVGRYTFHDEIDASSVHPAH